MKALMNLDYGSGNRDRRGPRYCEFPDCGQHTREGKAFCSEHVEHHPYAKWIAEQIQVREREIERGKKSGTRGISPKSGITRDLLGYVVESGCCTLDRLRRERMHDTDVKIVERYVRRMAKKGLVKLSKTTRGGILLQATASIESNAGMK